MSSQMDHRFSNQRPMASARSSATTEALSSVGAAVADVDSVAVVDAAMARAVAAARDKRVLEVVPTADLVRRRLKSLLL